MATSPSTAAQIAALQRDVAILAERLKNQEERHEQSPDSHGLPVVREVQARHDEKLDRALKERDESSRRFAQFALVATGVVGTLIAQLVVQLLLRLLPK